MDIQGWISEQIGSNEFFQGGLLIAVVSWIGFQVRAIPSKLMNFFGRYARVIVEFNYGNEQFDAMAHKISGFYTQSKSGQFIHVPGDDESFLVPSGSRWTRSGLCWINTIFSKRELTQGRSESAVTFTLVISAYGWKKRKSVENLIADATREYHEERRESLWVRVSSGTYWEQAGKLSSRTFDSVYSKWCEPIREDLDMFLQSEKQYVKKGIPYRRGYLLCGPPGTGKTTMAQAMANYSNRDLRCLGRVSGQALMSMMAGDKQMILIEDIDAIGNVAKSREDKSPNSELGLDLGYSLADLLNAIDGVSSGHGTILVVTTNHPEVLDKALLRKGRIDLRADMGCMTLEEWEKMCQAYFGKAVPWPCEASESTFTAAQAQGAYLESVGVDDFLARIKLLNC